MKRFNLGMLIIIILLSNNQTIDCRAVESSVTIQPSIADTYVNSMYLHTRYGEDPHGYLWAIFAGNMYVEYDSYKLYGSSRIYMKFNMTLIPKDAKILSANMCLYMYDSPKTSQEFEAYRVLSDWGEHKLIWISQPALADTPTATTTIDPTPGTWISWDVTRDLKIWHSGAAENFGTMIKIKHEMNASDQLASFYPRQGNQPARLKPKLIVKIDWYRSITAPSTPSPSPTETPPQTSPPTNPPTQILPPTNSNTATTTISNSIPDQTCATQGPSTPTSAALMLIMLIAGVVLVLKKWSRGVNSAKVKSSGGSEPNNSTERNHRQRA